MRELIRSIIDAETAYLAGDDQGVVDVMNLADIQVLKTGNDRRPGYSSLATMSVDLGQAVAVGFLATVKGAAEAQGGAEGDFLLQFMARFSTTPDGIDFTNQELIDQLVLIFSQSPIDVQQYLDLGYFFESAAQQSLGHDFTLANVSLARAEDAQDVLDSQAEAIRVEYAEGYNQYISGPLNTGDRAAIVAGLQALATSMGV